MLKKKKTILVIEDNEINREILNEIIGDKYILYFADNGKSGIELLRKHIDEIDLILLDIQMPEMDGHEVMQYVKNVPLLAHFPIIVATSNENYDEEAICLKLGANDFVKKPYNPTIVELRINNVINMHRSAHTLNAVEINKAVGVYTRNAFMHYATEWIKSNPEVDFSLTMTDIRGFRHLQAQFGDKAIDLLKKEIRAVQDNLGGNVMIGAYSFDKLVFLHPTPDTHISAEERAQKYESFAKQLSQQLHVMLKVAVCEHLDHHKEIYFHTNILHSALSEVKQLFNQHSIFVNQELIDKFLRKDHIEKLLESALKEGQMQVYYQPKHNAKTHELVGAEALVRWINPELGFVSPAEFIPVVEQNGFVVEIDSFVWRETCRNIRSWIDKGFLVVPISVNTSRLDLTSPDFDQRLDPIHDYQIPIHLLHMEITESLFENLSDSSVDRIIKMRDQGIKMELDDFGTGYSTLHSLAQLPIDIVKFDMSFVRKLNDKREQLVMKGCVDLIKSLNLKAIAEGVETEDIRQLIADFGIDDIQGYYYSKPLPVAQFEEYLKTHK